VTVGACPGSTESAPPSAASSGFDVVKVISEGRVGKDDRPLEPARILATRVR
jgi:hypothetical protein